MPRCDCGNTVTIGVNGYRTKDGEVVCDPCKNAAGAVRRVERMGGDDVE